MHVYAYLLLCLISMFACLDQGFIMLGTLHGLMLVGNWGHMLVCDCICSSCGLFGCDHLWDTSLSCWCAWYMPFSTSCDVMLALCHLFGFLYFFAFLLLAYMFMHKSLLACVIKPNSYYLVRVHTHLWYTRARVPFRSFVEWHMCCPYSNLMELWTPNPNIHLSSEDTPFLSFDNKFVCPLVCLTCFLAPVWLSLLVSLFVCFLFPFAISFACLLACSLLVACTCLEWECLERGHDDNFYTIDVEGFKLHSLVENIW